MNGRFNTSNPCALCGGTVGSGSVDANAHWLCVKLAEKGLPTPSMGDACPVCNGAGFRNAGSGVGVMLFLDVGPAAIQRSVEATFPKCVKCNGTGRAA